MTILAPAAPDPIASLDAVLPLVAAGAVQTDRDGRLAALEPLLDAGLFRLLMPAAVGGHQVDPVTFLGVLERLGRADASTGWCVCQTSVCSASASLLRLEAAREVFADRRAILAWGFGTDGRAIPCEGGWRISGSWAFGSGGHHATWLGGGCTICDADGTPAHDGAGRPVSRVMLFPQAKAEFTGGWDVVGLRGTGSNSYRVSGLVVPEAYSFQFGALPQPHARAALYRMPLDSLWAAGFASVALGVAWGMLDALIALAADKTPRGVGHRLAEAPDTQALVAEAEGTLRAARAFLHEAAETGFNAAEVQGSVSLDARMGIRLAASHAFRAARASTETLYHAAGATAVFAAGPFERRLRDMHAISQHVHARQSHFQSVGKYLLGMTPELQFL